MVDKEELTIEVKESIPMPEDEWVQVELTEIKPQDHPQYGKTYNFEFTITEEGFEGRKIWANISREVVRGLKSGIFVESLLGEEIEAGEQIHLGDCIGNLYEVFVEMGNKPDGSKKYKAAKVRIPRKSRARSEEKKPSRRSQKTSREDEVEKPKSSTRQEKEVEPSKKEEDDNDFVF